MSIKSGASVALAGMLSLTAVSCARVGQVQAMRALKQGNQAYQQQDYKKAADFYQNAISAAPDDPRVSVAYFFLGNSQDNLWKPSKKGDAANDALLNSAVENYQKAAEKIPPEPADMGKLKKLSLEYLVATYGPDKLNDPAKAEPVVQRMIQLEPSEPANYFALAKIYQDAGAYEEAEKVLLRAKEAKPNDPAVYMQLATYYNQQGQFDKTIEALQERAAKEPSNPEAFYTIATYYWDKAYRDFRIKDNEKKDYVQKGVEAVDHALQIKPDYMEALVYKNLLLRLQANMEKDPAKQQALLKQADQLRDKAQEMRKQKASGA